LFRPGDGSRLAAASLAGALTASAAGAAVRFEVAGSLRPAGAFLEVEVTLRNAGDRPAARVSVEGELAGATDVAQVDDVPAAAARRAVLRFPAEVPRPGVHAVALTVDYAEGAESPLASQRACLLLEVGATAEPAVRVAVPAAQIGSTGTVEVSLESADGAPHRARLRVLVPRDLRLDGPEAEIDVPPRGAVRVKLRAFRCSVPWGARRDVVAVAATGERGLERTSMAPGTVTVGPAPSLLSRLHVVLAVAAGVFLAAAVVVDVWRHRSSGDDTPPAGT